MIWPSYVRHGQNWPPYTEFKFSRICRMWLFCVNCFVTMFLLLGQRAVIRLLRCPACVWVFVYFSCARLSKHLSVVHSVVIVCAGDIRLLFKLQLKFRNVLKHAKNRSSLACNKDIKEEILTALKIFLCFVTKRIEMTYI